MGVDVDDLLPVPRVRRRLSVQGAILPVVWRVEDCERRLLRDARSVDESEGRGVQVILPSDRSAGAAGGL